MSSTCRSAKRAFAVKVFVVQDHNGRILGAKLTRDAAEGIAALHKHASITALWADKSTRSF